MLRAARLKRGAHNPLQDLDVQKSSLSSQVRFRVPLCSIHERLFRANMAVVRIEEVLVMEGEEEDEDVRDGG